MQTFLLTWDPSESRYGAGWSELSEDMRFSGPVASHWRFAFTQSERGDRVYLLRQRKEPRGIVATGTISGPPEQIGQTTYVPVLWSGGVDPDEPLPIHDLERLVPEQRWVVRRSGEPLLHGQDLVAEAWQRHVEQHPLAPWRVWLVRAACSGDRLTWPAGSDLPVLGDIVVVDAEPPLFGSIVDVVGREVTLEIAAEALDDIDVESWRLASGILSEGPDAIPVPMGPDFHSEDLGAPVDHIRPDEISGGRVVGQAMRRLGQNKVRNALLERYSNVCAISGPNPPEVLEAAHLRSFAEHETHDVDAGLLLRRDLHRLVDEGLLRIDPDTVRVVVDDRLMAFPVYAEFDGRELHVRLSDTHKEALRTPASLPAAAKESFAQRYIDPSLLVKVDPGETGDARPRDPGTPLETLDDLLRETGRDDLQDLVDHLTDYVDEDVHIELRDDGDDFDVLIRHIGAGVEFPTTLEDVYATVDGIMETLESVDEEAEREADDEV